MTKGGKKLALMLCLVVAFVGAVFYFTDGMADKKIVRANIGGMGYTVEDGRVIDRTIRFSFYNEKDEAVAVHAEIGLYIINSLEEIVYDDTITVEPKNFTASSSETGQEFVLHLTDEDFVPGSSGSGKIRCVIKTGDKTIETGYSMHNDNWLPLKQAQVELPVLPMEVEHIYVDGTRQATLKIEEVDCYTVCVGGESAELMIKLKGQKLEGDDGRQADRIGYRLYDADDNVLKDGDFYLKDIVKGDAFVSDYAYQENVIPGGEYRLELFGFDTTNR